MNKNDKTEAAKHLLDGIGGVRADFVSDAEIQKDELIEKKEVRSGSRLTEALIAAAAILIIGGVIWGILRSGKPDATSLFPEDYYRYWASEDNKDVYGYERIKPVDEMPKELVYTSQDVEKIMREQLGVTGELRTDMPTDDGQIVTYDEYRDGIQTGKAASVTYESGYIYYIVFRDATMTGETDPERFVSKKEVYEKSLAAIREKYADRNLDLKEDYNEAAITYYYNPQKKCYCYKFEIQGAVDGKWDDELSIHTFTPIVNVNDVNDIQIASTFGY